MPEVPPRLELRGLDVSYGGAPVLTGIDLVVAAGEVVAVLGPSGGGKSTLLRTIAGLVVPQAGTVALDGEDAAALPTHRRGVGLMFQDHALLPHRDVAANVGFGLRMAGVGAADRRARVAEVLELVGLAGFEGRRVASLSGGEAQRVALARSLAPRPRLLLLDEPLGSLDRTLHDRLVADLRRLVREQALTVVHVTHDQHEAMALADRLVVLGGGRVRQDGPVREVWRRPADEDVAAFLGLDAVIDAEVTDGTLRPLVDGRPGAPVAHACPIADGRWRVLVHPEAVAIEPRHHPDALDATVVEVTFGGERSQVVVRPAHPGVPALPVGWTGPPPHEGDALALRLHGPALHALAPRPS